MHTLRHAHEVSAFHATYPDPNVTRLVQQRYEELVADDDTTMEELVFFVVLEPADTQAQLEQVLGTELFTADGQRGWEDLEEHATCFEIVFVLSSSGYGALVLVPKLDADADLLALCRRHARPVHAQPET
jgi:hypothetical protein